MTTEENQPPSQEERRQWDLPDGSHLSQSQSHERTRKRTTGPLIEGEMTRISESLERVYERLDANSDRIDQISASLRELAMRPPPEIGKGITALISIAITVALASLAATLTTISLLLTHILGR